jgi:hypothetical protein
LQKFFTSISEAQQILSGHFCSEHRMSASAPVSPAVALS